MKDKNVSDEYLEQYFEAGYMNHEIHAFAQEGAQNHGLLNIAVDDFFKEALIKCVCGALRIFCHSFVAIS